MWVIPSDNAATDILGLVKRRISIVIKGGGINLKKIQIRFCILIENLPGNIISKSGGVPIAIPEAKKVIKIVEAISLIRGRVLNPFPISANEGKFIYEKLNGVNISRFSL
tara:strand:+ start:463 stop:792 length:330 start_codon:yes stop_codon:yes gene_type:complete